MALSHRDRDPRPHVAFVWLALGGVLVACSDDPVPVVGFAHPTLIEVSPEQFLGDVPCREAPGAMRRYVATVYDVSVTSDGENGAGGESSGGGAGGEGSETREFALPSSTVLRGDGLATPTPCTQSVGFSRIVPGNKYRAEIDGYDRDDLVALEPGLRILVDPLTNERVVPRWTTNCGKDVPVTSWSGIVRTVGNCDPLVDSALPAETLVEVRIDDALGSLECGAGPSDVERFEVLLPDGTVMDAPCGEAVTLTGLEPTSATLTLRVQAFAAGASGPAWGTTCVADVIEGVTTTAACQPLDDTGVLEVDPLVILAALGLECDASAFEELEVVLEVPEGEDPDPRYVDPNECSRPLRFQGRAQGASAARATARFADGSRSGTTVCTATIVPGDISLAVCAAP